jgi:hypothetical protein
MDENYDLPATAAGVEARTSCRAPVTKAPLWTARAAARPTTREATVEHQPVEIGADLVAAAGSHSGILECAWTVRRGSSRTTVTMGQHGT